MAKKRKASGRPFGQSKTDERSTVGDSKLLVNSYKDVADSEDEFHLNRDEILLDEGPDAKRARKWREKDEFLEQSEEEVLDYASDSAEEESQVETDEDGGEGDYSFGKIGTAHDQEESEAEDAHEDEDGEGWGPRKSDYYDADVIETEQDALDEEAEARRIQQKQLAGLTEADFAFDESEWRVSDKPTGAGDVDAEADEEKDVVTEVLPQLQITEDMGAAERLKILKARYPEFEPLSKEFLNLQETYKRMIVDTRRAEDLRQGEGNSGSISDVSATNIKIQALTAYLGSLAMYFAILTSPSSEDERNAEPLAPIELRDHPVMDSLVKTRALWYKAKDLQVKTPKNRVTGVEPAEPLQQASGTSSEQLATLPHDDVKGKKQAEVRPKKTKAQKAAEAAKAESEARRAERMHKTEEELAALSILLEKQKHRNLQGTAPSVKGQSVANGDDSDLGEEPELNAQEAAEKARKRKSLRFYTSQITQKANKRGTAGRDAGGDADIPYRERLKDRQARLNAEAERRGKAKPVGSAADAFDDQSDDEDGQQAHARRGDREPEGNAGHDEDYYGMIAARTQLRKTERKQLAEAHAEAAKQGGRIVEVEEVGPDGKRAISYAIEKNKGLTPKRSRESRNPRVKKRKKFEDKKKKLGSVRPVYKGGEGRGGYKGELSGIKKGIIKSVKL